MAMSGQIDANAMSSNVSKGYKQIMTVELLKGLEFDEYAKRNIDTGESAIAVHESQETGMRLWKSTRDGMNLGRGVGTEDWESRIGRWGIDAGDASKEFEWREDFLRLTGPGPDE